MSLVESLLATIQEVGKDIKSLKSAGGGSGSGMKNRIINGDMQVSQYYGNASVTINGYGEYYVADRWVTNGPVVVQRVSASAAGFPYGIQLTGINPPGTYGTNGVLYTNLESKDLLNLAGQTCTLSFTVYNSGAQKTIYALAMYFGIPDMAIFSKIDNYPLTIPSGWSTQSVTFVANALIVNGVRLMLNFGSMAEGATCILTGVQLEKGSSATSFEYRNYSTELALCQRYYTRYDSTASQYAKYGLGDTYSSTNMEAYLYLPVEMRTTPSLKTSGVASQYAIYSAGAITPCSVLPTMAQGSSSKIAVLNCTASGLTAGRAAQLISNANTSSYIGLFADF